MQQIILFWNLSIPYILYSSKMNSQWELPLIMNQASKQKYNSISPQKQSRNGHTIHCSEMPFLSQQLKKHHKSNFSLFQLNPKVSTDLGHRVQRPYRKKPERSAYRKKSTRKFKSELAGPGQKSVQNSLVQSAYQQLEIFIIEYFKQKIFDETQTQKQKLKKIIKNPKKVYRKVTLRIDNGSETIFLDEAINLMFHEFKAETSLAENKLQSALYHFARAQYFSLNQGLIPFGIYCLTQQAFIQRQKGELQLELQCLKKALSLSIQAEREDITSVVLQKIGVTYYYHGNTVMGQYFHLFSQRGLSHKDLDFYSRELKLQRYLRVLKQKLFGIAEIPIDQDECECKQIDLNTLNNQVQSQAIDQQHFKNMEIVSEMLKDNRSRMIGQKLQNQMMSTMEVAKIHPFKDFSPKNENQSKQLPLINISRVLKSHLSLNRHKGSQQKREWQLSRLQEIINN